MADSKDKGSLADQLAGLSISVKEEEPEAEPEDEVREPEPPSDEEAFARAMEGLSDDELAAEMARRKPKTKDKGTLGEAMESVLADVKPVDSKRRMPREPEVPKAPSGGARGVSRDGRQAAERAQRDIPMSDDELFEAAVDDLTPEDVYRGKYFGGTNVPETSGGLSTADFGASGTKSGNESGNESGDEPVDEQKARDKVKDLQNQRTLEKALGGIDKKIDSSKYRVKKTKPRPYSSEPNREMNTDPLPKSGPGLSEVDLAASHKQLLKRYERRKRDRQIPELNLRGDTLDDALRQLELFAHKSWKEERGFIRIIHGKGMNSEGDPVIKPAVLKWLEGPGFRYVRGYAPEVGRSGNYGAVIVELRPVE